MATSNKSGKTNEELMAPLTSLISKGRREGVLTSAELLSALEKLDLSVEKVEQVYEEHNLGLRRSRQLWRFGSANSFWDSETTWT